MHLFSQKQRLLCCSLNFPVSAPEKLSTMAGIVVKSPIRRSACHSSRAGEHDTSVKNKTIYAEPEFETALSLGLGKCSLSKTDHQILSLMQNLPRKKSLSTNLENFQLYQPALKLYKAITSERPPSEQPSDEIMLLPDRSIRRKVYQLVFDALYRKWFTYEM